MEYRDFDVRLREGPSGDWLADVRAPDGAESATAIRFPYDEATLRERVSQLARHVVDSRDVDLLDGPTSRIHSPQDPQDFGDEIFRALIREQAADLYRVSLAQVREVDLGLRIRLSNEVPALAAVPWEFMYDREEGEYLALSTETPLVRFMRLTRPAGLGRDRDVARTSTHLATRTLARVSLHRSRRLRCTEWRGIDRPGGRGWRLFQAPRARAEWAPRRPPVTTSLCSEFVQRRSWGCRGLVLEHCIGADAPRAARSRGHAVSDR
jgi:hypothetical protein